MPRQLFVDCLSPESVTAGLHRMAYQEWGDAHNPKVLLCIHGVSRTGRDFDDVAQALQNDYRVVTVDVVGRGHSSRFKNPALYAYPQYMNDMLTLLARLFTNTNSGTLDIFGTSMGGLIGLGLAALRNQDGNNLVRKFIINDVGPKLEMSALARIGEYLSTPVLFDTFEQATVYMKTVAASFGAHSDAQWAQMARGVFKQTEQGKWTRDYDLGIAHNFSLFTPEVAAMGEATLWAAWKNLTCQTLVVRGAESDLLSPETYAQMGASNPHARLLTLPNCGHAPSFMHAAQINHVKEFLLEK